MDLPGLLSSLTGVEVLELSFEAGTYDSFLFEVLTFQTREALSEPFDVEVELIASPTTVIDEALVVGARATFSAQARGRGHGRVFHGVVAEFQRGKMTADKAAPVPYRARLRPRFWTLQHTRRHRFFEEDTVVGIVKRVLDAADVPSAFVTTRRYQQREYTVQYGESDFAFVSRLLEEEGLRYFFRHEGGEDILAITDGPAPFVEGQPRLPFRIASNLGHAEDAVTQLERTRALAVQHVFLRDHHFVESEGGLDAVAPAAPAAQGAGQHDPSDSSGPPKDLGGGKLEVYQYPGGFQQWADGAPLANVHLEELQGRADLQRGHATTLRFTAGHQFELDQHPLPGFNGRYQLIETVHTGAGPKGPANLSHECHFISIPADVRFRPPRTTPRPSIPGTLTAVVVGPGTEEIFTDEHGRVKVQFHWDRESARDDHSSCWIRVAQSWAGQGWGALYLPRVGHEVVITFLDGDPDRPLIIGATYNGKNPPPVLLPADKSRSTLRSNSTPGGGGANEISFEDDAGKEKLGIHAQKDLAIEVEHDRTLTVTGHETTVVTGNRTREVGGNQVLTVHQDDRTVVELDQAITVGQARTVKVGGDHLETVGGGVTLTVGGARTETIGEGSTETVGLAKAVAVDGAYALQAGSMIEEVTEQRVEDVGGKKTVVIGGRKKDTVTGTHSQHVLGDSVEQIDGKLAVEALGPVTTTAHGNLTQTAKQALTLSAKEIALVAKETVTITAGANKLTITKDGDIKLNGKKLEISATGDIALSGRKLDSN